MTIVAYGYGRQLLTGGVSQVLAGEVFLELLAEPDIELDEPVIELVLETDTLDIIIDTEIDIEIEDGV